MDRWAPPWPETPGEKKTKESHAEKKSARAQRTRGQSIVVYGLAESSSALAALFALPDSVGKQCWHCGRTREQCAGISRRAEGGRKVVEGDVELRRARRGATRSRCAHASTGARVAARGVAVRGPAAVGVAARRRWNSERARARPCRPRIGMWNSDFGGWQNGLEGSERHGMADPSDPKGGGWMEWKGREEIQGQLAGRSPTRRWRQPP